MPVNTPDLRKYKLLDLIGCGGMGYVYAGYDAANNPVAIKILAPEYADVEPVFKRFKLEGEILRGLNHPYIVKFVDMGQEGSYHYVAMEYVKGICLDSFPLSHSATSCGVDQPIPPITDYLRIFIRCMEAMSFFHKKGLVHRDIKPQNIILQGEELMPKFIDFGIAQKVEDDDSDPDAKPENLYTVVYASPEQLTNKSINIQSDLFSFGVVMYEKLTGKLPFEGRTAMEVFLCHAKGNYAPPRQVNSEIPQKLEDIIVKLLQKDPAMRYPSATMVQGELERLLDVLQSGQKGLSMSGVIGEIRSGIPGVDRRVGKRISVSEEQNLLKKARNEFVEAKNQLRSATSKYKTNPEQVQQLKLLCHTLQNQFEGLQEQVKMNLGFKSQPLILDRFNSIIRMDKMVYEKRGISFTINTIEQKLTHTDGEDIIVGSINFTEKAKRFFSRNYRDTFLTWDETNWFFQPYEEKHFPVFFMVGDRTLPHSPHGFRGLFWPFEFLVAIQKLGRTGVAIVETYRGVDRHEKAVFATHKEVILFSQSLIMQANAILAQMLKKGPAKA
ncbi:MAG TPA: serine/threonine-protein kinase [Candidatus Ozemobacteraceae bacterium]|nr:serine/threonine-protein kinase [Candidatus Ozemobacteraceae bacterium]